MKIERHTPQSHRDSSLNLGEQRLPRFSSRVSLLILSSSLILLLTSCVSEGTLTEAPAALVMYQTKPSDSRLVEVARSYAEAINANLGEGLIHPGLYAEYGVTLARLGCLQQANTMFNNELRFFPGSQWYIEVLKATLTPAFAADTLWDTTRINIKSLDTIPVTLTDEEEALQRQQASDPEYQRFLKAQQREEREQQAIEKEKAKKEQKRARQEEQKAKKKAREQAKREKEAAKRAEKQAKEDAIRAEQQRQDSIARAEQKAQKALEKQERQRLAELDAQRREQERQARREARKKRREEFARKYEAWLIKNGYREAPDSTDVQQPEP